MDLNTLIKQTANLPTHLCFFHRFKKWKFRYSTKALHTVFWRDMCKMNSCCNQDQDKSSLELNAPNSNPLSALKWIATRDRFVWFFQSFCQRFDLLYLLLEKVFTMFTRWLFSKFSFRSLRAMLRSGRNFQTWLNHFWC